MKNNPSKLIKIADISYPLVGVYDVPDKTLFQPLKTSGQCIFEHFSGWLNGESTVIDSETAASFTCPGAGYWTAGIEAQPREDVAYFLAGIEGLKESPDVMCRWLENCPPYRPESNSIVISTLREDHHEYLKTITFFVNSDQLALLITGAEHLNASPDQNPVLAPYGSGCGQLLTMFPNLDEPKALIGTTDIAMRKHLPKDILAFTVTKPMFEQLCGLDENSFLHKTFWNDLKQARELQIKDKI